MMCIATVRRLKPGTYEAFREAWQPDPWPPAVSHALHMRNAENPDEVCSILFIDRTPAEVEALRDDPEFVASEARRIERLAPYEDGLLVNGVFDVVEEVRPATA